MNFLSATEDQSVRNSLDSTLKIEQEVCQLYTRIDKGIIVLGNESNGISKEVSKYIDKWISIKKYGNAESLNVAISSAIILDNIRNS